MLKPWEKWIHSILVTFSLVVIFTGLINITVAIYDPLMGRRFYHTVTRINHLGYGSCGRCWATWDIASGHTIEYGPHFGIFPLCDICYSETTIAERGHYVREAFMSWESKNKETWHKLRRAYKHEAEVKAEINEYWKKTFTYFYENGPRPQCQIF